MGAPAISAPDRAKYVAHPQTFNSLLWIDAPPIVYQGLINEPSGVTYPIVNPINYDNGSGTLADCEIDQMITFGTTAGGDDLGRTRIKGITGSTIGIPRASQGTVDGTVKIVNDTHFTIYDHFFPAPKLPFFDVPFQTFYKDGDLVFVAALPPVANIGYSHAYAGLVDSLDKLTLTIDSSTSFSPIGGTLTRLWDVKDGTITVGTTSSTAITVEFPVGRRWINLLLTDTTNSRATFRRLLVVACKRGTAYAPIVDVKAGTLTQTVEGLRQSFSFGQDIPADEYLDGVPVIYWQEEYYVSDEESLNSTTPVKFAGWHHIDPARIAATPTHLQRDTTLECLDTAGKLATFPGFPQSIESNSSPTRWEEMASPNLDKFLAYLWLYHSTAPSLVDFAWSGTTTTYPFFRLNSLGNSLYGQIDGRARAIGYRLLSDRAGKCTAKKDPLLFDSGDRTATNTIALTEADIVSIAYTHQRPSRSHWNRGNAIIASASAYNAAFCIAPGIVPSWGLGATETGENLVADQDELNTRVGNAYQRENAPESYLEVELLHSGDIYYEPLDFVQLTLSAAYAAQRGLTFTAERFMIVAIATDYDPAFGTQRRRLTLERETFGTPAETEIPPENPLPAVTPVTELYPPNDTVVTDGFSLAAISASGFLHITENFNVPSSSGGPTWTSVDLSLVGTAIEFVSDPYSPGFISTGAINGWIVTTQRIYRITDIFGSPSVASQFTFRADNSNIFVPFQGRSIGIERAVQNWLVVSSRYDSTLPGTDEGTWVTYTTDGSTWATEVRLSEFYARLGILTPGIYVSAKTAGLAYTSAFVTPSGDSADSIGWKTTDYGANWSTMSDPDISGKGMAVGLHVPFNNNPSENIAYFGYFDWTGATMRVYRAVGGTQTDITPTVSSNNYINRPGYCRSIAAAATNRLSMVLCGEYTGTFGPDGNAPTNVAVFVSTDGGDNWTPIYGPVSYSSTASYNECDIDGSNPDKVYAWGDGGRVAVGSIIAQSLDERGPGGSSPIVGITGN